MKSPSGGSHHCAFSRSEIVNENRRPVPLLVMKMPRRPRTNEGDAAVIDLAYLLADLDDTLEPHEIRESVKKWRRATPPRNWWPASSR